jgi:hypothetical protein
MTEWSRTNVAVLIAAAVGVVVLLVVLLSGSGGGDVSEVERVVAQIRAAELDHYAKYREYVATGWAPRPRFEVDGSEVAWASEPGFQRLGFAPDAPALVGTYRVTVDERGFVVTGVCDVDGDGHQRVVTATATQEATVSSGDEL